MSNNSDTFGAFGSQQIPMPEIIHKVSHSPAKMSQTIRSPLKGHGGKFYLSADLLAVCRPAMVQAEEIHEPCCLGANFSLQYQPLPGQVQFIADADQLVYLVWRCFADPEAYASLVNTLRTLPVDKRETMEATWQGATMLVNHFRKLMREEPRNPAEIPWSAAIGYAAAFIVNRRMSRGGMGENFAWQDRERGGRPGEINSWLNFVESHALRVSQRMGNIIPVYMSIMEGVKRWGPNPKAFAYIDPPYPVETRTAPKVYDFEWYTYESDIPAELRGIAVSHERFLEEANKCECKLAISTYDNELYAAELTGPMGWHRHRFAIVNHSGQNKKKEDRVEILYTNF